LVYLDVASTAAALTFAAGAASAALLRPDAWDLGLTLKIAFGSAVFAFLWREGQRTTQFQWPPGLIFGEFLVLAGFAQFILGALRLAQPRVRTWPMVSVISGALVIVSVLIPFVKKSEEHRILSRIAVDTAGERQEYAPATSECPHPERWKMLDSMSAEVEVLNALKQLVLTLKPQLIVETGTFIASSTIKMAEGLRENAFGKIITCEFDPVIYAKANERINASGLSHWIDCRNHSSLEMQIHGTIDLFFSDSRLAIRESEIRHFLPQISPTGLILMHDTSSHYKVARDAAFRLEQEGLISMILLPTPRGLMMAQKRSGRK
jgi:predicted O-methyltransferase YrrM